MLQRRQPTSLLLLWFRQPTPGRRPRTFGSVKIPAQMTVAPVAPPTLSLEEDHLRVTPCGLHLVTAPTVAAPRATRAEYLYTAIVGMTVGLCDKSRAIFETKAGNR
jgi:hypothetical protein